jgi:hypothetical protein
MHRTATCLAGISLSLFLACASRDSGGKTILPPPPANAPPAPYTPANPFEADPGGSSSRNVFQADSGRGFTVLVRDYLVPLDRPVTIDFDGAAVVEVRQGGGEVTAGGVSRKVAQGDTFTVSDTEKLQAVARGEPMVLRAWIYR